MPHEIVHPEPHSTGNPGDGWKYVPRWLQIILWIIVIAAIILAPFLLRWISI
jgi:hypothetical protein